MAEEQERDGALILTLPDETLLAVLKNLTAQWDRQSWCVVCKKFRDLEGVGRTCVGVMRAEILEPVLRRYHYVEHLDLSSCLEVKDVCLATVAKFTSQRLLSITLSGTVGFGIIGVRSLVECTSLREVDLSCTQVRDEEVIALSELQHLQKLKLNDCKYVTGVGLSALSNCKELEYLGLRSCSRIGDVDIQNVATGCLQLRTIDLSFSEVSDSGLAFLALLRNLECLNLEYLEYMTDDGLKPLKDGCTTLQKLVVGQWDTAGCPVLVALIERSLHLQELNLSYCRLTSNMLFSSFQKLKMLQVITLDHCFLSKAELNLVGRGCGDLKELNLRWCKGVTDDGVVGVVTAHTDLKKLDLTRCCDITDIALKAVVANCRGLLSLKMENCRSVTVKGLALIGEFCLSLEDLDLTDCKVNDDELKSIARCSKLKFLKIGFCMNITNAGLVHIGATCKNLLGFDCSRSVGIGDEGVAAMVSGCKRLKRVILSQCESITDASLQSLASLRDLQTLDLRACKQVTSIGFFHIAASCRHLQELDVTNCSLVGDPGVFALSYGCQNLRKINLSRTAVTDVGMMALASMPCLQVMDLGLQDLRYMKVSIDGLAKAVLTCGSLKYLTVPRSTLPFDVILRVKNRGTKLR